MRRFISSYDRHHVPHLVVEEGAAQHRLLVNLDSCIVGQEVVMADCVSKSRARAGRDRGEGGACGGHGDVNLRIRW